MIEGRRRGNGQPSAGRGTSTWGLPASPLPCQGSGLTTHCNSTQRNWNKVGWGGNAVIQKSHTTTGKSLTSLALDMAEEPGDSSSNPLSTQSRNPSCGDPQRRSRPSHFIGAWQAPMCCMVKPEMLQFILKPFQSPQTWGGGVGSRGAGTTLKVQVVGNPNRACRVAWQKRWREASALQSSRKRTLWGGEGGGGGHPLWLGVCEPFPMILRACQRRISKCKFSTFGAGLCSSKDPGGSGSTG